MPQANTQRTVKLNALARLLGIQIPTLRVWRNEGIPLNDDDFASHPETLKWLAEQKPEVFPFTIAQESGNSLTQDELRYFDGEKRKREIEILDIKKKETLKELLPKDEVFKTVQNAATITRERILASAVRSAKLGFGAADVPALQQVIQKELELALEGLEEAFLSSIDDSNSS